MATFSKYKSSILESGKRILKVFQFGAKTAKESYPFGFDSVPLEDYTAIYLETSNASESIIVGYINKNQIAKAGEARMYAMGNDGELLGYVYAREDGSIELSGNEFNAVRFSPLNEGLKAQAILINAELTKISNSIALLSGVYSPAHIDINIELSESKSVKLK